MGQARCWEPNTSRHTCSPKGLRLPSGSFLDKPLSRWECWRVLGAKQCWLYLTSALGIRITSRSIDRSVYSHLLDDRFLFFSVERLGFEKFRISLLLSS